eukprot:TRINITY_DN9888_c0_g1_i3.p1 TRINITY_DN9888_c0_g1~~TRINITY_DN9888_c0_g1_i3.p1  ORF type:complete len:206 (+),score=32.14 TRINITY_DN9888_c0_g1_i3:149-766(+)
MCIRDRKFPADYAIAWIKMCQPGSVSGLYQQFLIRWEWQFLKLNTDYPNDEIQKLLKQKVKENKYQFQYTSNINHKNFDPINNKEHRFYSPFSKVQSKIKKQLLPTNIFQKQLLVNSQLSKSKKMNSGFNFVTQIIKSQFNKTMFSRSKIKNPFIQHISQTNNIENESSNQDNQHNKSFIDLSEQNKEIVLNESIVIKNHFTEQF